MDTLFLTGLMLALCTACLWALSPLCWASAGRRIGSLPVLYLRTWGASVILLGALALYLVLQPQARALPNAAQILWMSLSALAGLTIGDAFSYEAMVLLGPRRSTQAVVLAPVSAVAVGWLALGETLTAKSLLGVVTVLIATSYAVTARPDLNSKEPGAVTARGVLYAAGGALAIGLGAVAARQAFLVGPLDALTGTTIRMTSSAVMLLTVALLRGELRATCRHVRDRWVLNRLIPGLLAGPVIGMVCYVAALKYMESGLASTVSSMSPLFILPLVSFRYRSRIGWRAVIAAAAALAGVALICLR